MSISVQSSICRQCRARLGVVSSRKLHSNARLRQQDDPFSAFDQAFREEAARQPNRGRLRQSSVPARRQVFAPNEPRPSANIEQLAQNAKGEAATRPLAGAAADEPYHLNVYSHKHNTHITFTEPSRNPILSYSAGNIGLRKAQRGTFDAAYQLATYTMRKMAEKNWKIGGKKTSQIPLTLNDERVKEKGIEIVLRGYGPGREAFQKAILGAEGRLIKTMVTKVTDGTRLKFGGTRSPAVRRLG